MILLPQLPGCHNYRQVPHGLTHWIFLEPDLRHCSWACALGHAVVVLDLCPRLSSRASPRTPVPSLWTNCAGSGGGGALFPSRSASNPSGQSLQGVQHSLTASTLINVSITASQDTEVPGQPCCLPCPCLDWLKHCLLRALQQLPISVCSTTPPTRDTPRSLRPRGPPSAPSPP